MSHATVLIASDAGHFVHHDDPELALEAVRRVLDEVAVHVDRETLATYVGEYRFSPNFSIAVTLEADGLAIQATNQGKLGIRPRSEVRFRVQGVDAEVSFVRENGRVTSLILHQNGIDQVGEKLE